MRNICTTAILFASLSLLGCGDDDPAGVSGSGSVAFTTWGEEYIEEGIPSDPDGGFVDGWSVTYDKFLVNIGGITVANSGGDEAASQAGHVVFNHVGAGVKSIVEFDEVPAGSWEDVGYEIVPVTSDTEADASVSDDDLAMMQDEGLSVYLEGSAENGSETIHFAWGFTLATKYENCRAEVDGVEREGIVVNDGGSQDIELTIHGDHPFYDRLQASPDPSVTTSLRFQALAEADEDGDGELTLEELDAKPLDVTLYDPSGLDATTHGDFVRELVRTIGHFRGEGECSLRRL